MKKQNPFFISFYLYIFFHLYIGMSKIYQLNIIKKTNKRYKRAHER